MRRAERLQAITDQLRRAGTTGLTAARLAARFEVSVRTIKRDLASLERAGLPIWTRPGPGGGCGLTEAATMKPIRLSAEQAVAISAAVHASVDAPYADQARAGVEKILDTLDPDVRVRVSELGARVWVDPAPHPDRGTMSALEQAVLEHVVVRLCYTDAHGAASVREVDPLIFASHGGRWYLVGWCHLRRAIRWFDLTRITGATATQRPGGRHAIEDIGKPPPTATPTG